MKNKIYKFLFLKKINLTKAYRSAYYIFKKRFTNNYLIKSLSIISIPYFTYKIINNIINRKIDFYELEFPITTICSLKCKYCSNLIPRYENPINFPTNVLIQDIESLFGMVSKIYNLKILGGEPFLHEKLDKILDFIIKSDKIVYITIISNSTIVPNEKILNILKNKKIEVKLSNYNNIKELNKVDEIIKVFEKYKIKYQVINNPWFDFGNFKSRNRNIKQLREIFFKCPNRYFANVLFNGQYYICPRSAHGTDLGLIPKKKNEYFNLRSNKSNIEKKEELMNLINKIEFINTCNYCDECLIENPNYNIEVTPGEQN
ncbi:MAG: radical SAM protein [Methanobrevibacter sp.]|jgi:organic radical activating enzyme|nr:radical SAM protein [Methanobrevibacter sp.]